MNDFSVMPPSAVYETIQAAIDEIEARAPEGDSAIDHRAKALTLTKLEEAQMWSLKIYKTPINEEVLT